MNRADMEERRMLAIELFKSGLKQNQVATRLGVTRTSAFRWHAAISAGSNMKLRKSPGRPRTMSTEQEESILSFYLDRRSAGIRTPGRVVQEEMKIRYGIEMNIDHVCRILKGWRENTR